MADGMLPTFDFEKYDPKPLGYVGHPIVLLGGAAVSLLARDWKAGLMFGAAAALAATAGITPAQMGNPTDGGPDVDLVRAGATHRRGLIIGFLAGGGTISLLSTAMVQQVPVVGAVAKAVT